MKMIDSIQEPLFLDSAEVSRPAVLNRDDQPVSHFDIHDREGRTPELICRIILGLCLGFSLVQCAFVLAGF